jgi:hypothetical protein
MECEMDYDDWIKVEYEEAAKLLKDNYDAVKKLFQLAFALNGGLFAISVNTLRSVTDDKNKSVPLIIAFLALILNQWFFVAIKRAKEKTIYLYSKLIEIENNINNAQGANDKTYHFSIYKNLQDIDQKLKVSKKSIPLMAVQALWILSAIWLLCCLFAPVFDLNWCVNCNTYVPK